LSDRGGGSKRKIRDFTEVVALTKNGETLVAEPIAEHARQDTDQKFAQYRGLFQEIIRQPPTTAPSVRNPRASRTGSTGSA
jgi:hypothetical protein